MMALKRLESANIELHALSLFVFRIRNFFPSFYNNVILKLFCTVHKKVVELSLKDIAEFLLLFL